MVRAYTSDLGWIVKLSRPFEAEMLRSISKLNAPSRLGVRGRSKARRRQAARAIKSSVVPKRPPIRGEV
jgi:hypothetical protein